MRNSIGATAVACFCLIATAASAGGNHEQPHGQPTSTTPTYNATANNTALAGAASRSTAASVSRSASHATGGNASAQGGQGGRGGQANNGGQTMNYSGGNYSARGNNVDAFAPSIATANECALPKSAGASFLGIGMSGGFANESDACKHQRLAMMLERMGDRKGAREALCLDEDMRRAAYSSGSPCARDVHGWVR